eukprot:TRINITY_DN23942_c0_g1_i1.p1 TRINITY_DN23942_c0_g1~~TRINITY_DN23942_c0_g1_i1.p1  ORF type:complete len:414 (-),score=57.47 TRINITY_DN23942_c0_g1_i1:55-1257(-)
MLSSGLDVMPPASWQPRGGRRFFENHGECRRRPSRWTRLAMATALARARGAGGLGGITHDERLQYSDGSWHRAQRSRVAFETACYFNHEPELQRGCQYNSSTSDDWAGEEYRDEQRAVLDTFYRATKGDGWRFNENWLEGDPCWDFWYGVTCDEHGHVIYLELPDNRLKGRLPPILGNVVSLLKLDISSTMEWYMGHPNVDINQVGGFMPSLAKMAKLAELEVSGNRLKSLPDDLHKNAMSLRVLSASRNLITEFPEKLNLFTILHTLELDRNLISQPFPEEFSSMRNLRNVQLSYNQITGQVPETIVNLRHIETFDISHNPGVDGEVPAAIIVQWPRNEYISILNTSITGFLSSLCLDVPFCWRFMYDTHQDLTWATAADVPDIVNLTMQAALKKDLPF